MSSVAQQTIVANPLQDLPVELIIGIFESIDDIDSIRALSVSSKHLNNIWKAHGSHIMRSILNRQIPSPKVQAVGKEMLAQFEIYRRTYGPQYCADGIVKEGKSHNDELAKLEELLIQDKQLQILYAHLYDENFCSQPRNPKPLDRANWWMRDNLFGGGAPEPGSVTFEAFCRVYLLAVYNSVHFDEWGARRNLERNAQKAFLADLTEGYTRQEFLDMGVALVHVYDMMSLARRQLMDIQCGDRRRSFPQLDNEWFYLDMFMGSEYVGPWYHTFFEHLSTAFLRNPNDPKSNIEVMAEERSKILDGYEE